MRINGESSYGVADADEPVGYDLRPGAEPRRAERGRPPDLRDVSARAGIVVTGTEVLSGIISDPNGPWLSERLREQGVDCAQITIVGDRPEDMRAALDAQAALGST